MQQAVERVDKGLYTQIPDVIFTCSLSDEALMMFNRLYCQTKFKDYTFYGSIRKLASALNLKRDKAHRNLNILVASGLVTLLDVDDINATAIKLNLDELWELNKSYHEGVDIPAWTNLQDVLNGVRKIGQDVLETGQDSANIGQSVRFFGQGVRRSEHKVPPKISKNIKDITKIRKKKEPKGSTASTDADIRPALPPEEKKTSKRGRRPQETKKPDTPQQPKLIDDSIITLSAEEQVIYEMWCNIPANRGFRPKIKQIMKDHFSRLVPVVKTQGEMNALYEFTRKQPFMKGKGIQLGNLVNYVIAWCSTLPPEEKTEIAKAEEENTKMVIWGNFPNGPYSEREAVKHWHEYRRMTLAEARKYNYDPSCYPGEVLAYIDDMLYRVEEGEIEMPVAITA